MKKELLFSLCFCLSFLLQFACSDDKEDLLPIDEDWKALNEAKIEEVKKMEENSVLVYTPLKSLNEMGYIYYKVIHAAEATPDNPLIKYGEKVFANYEGTRVDGTIFDSQNEDDGDLTGITTGNGVEGWNTAVQYMRVGDKWEVWIPQELAYGRRGDDRNSSNIIQPYSALHFTIEVVRVDRIK